EITMPVKKDLPIIMCVSQTPSSDETQASITKDKEIEQIRNEQVSTSGTTLKPLIAAKTELVQLQMKQQKKQYEDSERREQELFLLKKRSLELDITIKEQHLKKLKAQLLNSF
ncbi:hypothetical protein L9F63_025477, partial [Diploptera punctata]